MTGASTASTAARNATSSADGGAKAATAQATFDRTCSRVHIPTRVVAISSWRTACWMARRARSPPRARQRAAAAAHASFSAGGAGCQAGGPASVSKPMERGEALMTPTCLARSRGSRRSSAVSARWYRQYESAWGRGQGCRQQRARAARTTSTQPGGAASSTRRKTARGSPVMPMWRTCSGISTGARLRRPSRLACLPRLLQRLQSCRASQLLASVLGRKRTWQRLAHHLVQVAEFNVVALQHVDEIHPKASHAFLERRQHLEHTCRQHAPLRCASHARH